MRDWKNEIQKRKAKREALASIGGVWCMVIGAAVCVLAGDGGRVLLAVGGALILLGVASCMWVIGEEDEY